MSKWYEVEANEDYWYIHRYELLEGMVFRCWDGSLVKLDRRVPGDGTQWYVADWFDGWIYEDNTVEPGDLRGEPITSDLANMPRDV